jgi:hypothetical protein
MAPILLFVLALMAGDEAPISTQTPHAPAPVAAAPATPAEPMAGAISRDQVMGGMSPDVSPPGDDYGYVSWCYGALSGYLGLYDRALPEVTRIENEFPSPEGVENDMKVYPALRAQARSDVKLYAAAMSAAQKASLKRIGPYGAAQAERGRSIWDAPMSSDKARLAQLWMSWSPPEKCEITARKLKTRASVLGKALAQDTPDLPTGDAKP